MPINKNALIRYNILDNCFSDNNKFYTFERLLDVVNDRLDEMDIKGISPRQLREDIRFMRCKETFNAPIETYQYEGQSRYYKYSTEGYSIHKTSLSDEDSELLHKIIETLYRFRGVANGAWMDEIISNLEFRFNLKRNHENIISFDNNERLKGIEFLSEMINATINNQPLKIRYHTFGSQDLYFTYHPYHIKQYNNRWYAVGLSKTQTNSGIYIIGLDRIVSIKKHNTTFIHNKTIDFTTYFNNVIGVTRCQGNVETIKLRFDKMRFKYVITKPIHNSQEIVDRDNCIVSIKVVPNRELYSKIFEFGPDVEVLEPLSIRNDFKRHYEECLKHYTI